LLTRYSADTPNRHRGQGTACRRFFSRNAALELLWVELENGPDPRLELGFDGETAGLLADSRPAIALVFRRQDVRQVRSDNPRRPP
jgi:hypothetical protein